MILPAPDTSAPAVARNNARPAAGFEAAIKVRLPFGISIDRSSRLPWRLSGNGPPNLHRRPRRAGVRNPLK
jgi:hypothetical protein